MADDVRPDDVQDDDDAVERSMTVAAWAVIVTIGAAFVALWAASMHAAATGKGLW